MADFEEDGASPREPFLKNEVDTDLDSESTYYSPPQVKHRVAAARARTWPWIFSTVFFAFTTALLLLRSHTGTKSHADTPLCVENPRGIPLGPGM